MTNWEMFDVGCLIVDVRVAAKKVDLKKSHSPTYLHYLQAISNLPPAQAVPIALTSKIKHPSPS